MLPNNNPPISVLMPAYNAEEYIAEAIESILNQTFKYFEFIIVDDCSTDSTLKIIQEYAKVDKRIIVRKNEKNLKICGTLNKGIELAGGKYIARMDADDWSYPDRLYKQFRFMEKNPDIVLSGGTIEICDEKMNVLNKRKYSIADEEIRKKIFRYSPFGHPATIWKTEIIKKSGSYNEAFIVAQEYDLYFRVGKMGKFGNLLDTIYRLRIHNKSSSQTFSKKQEINTLFIRLKAHIEYGYKLSILDKCYLVMQYLSMYLISQKLKFWFFNFLRK